MLSEIKVVITGVASGLNAAVNEADGALKRLGGGMETAGQSIKSAGSTFMPFSIAAGAALALAAHAAEEFQGKMELVKTQAGASQQEVDKMTASVLKLAPATEFGPNQLADALFHIESVGLRGAKAMDTLKVASEGAAVGHADLESVTNALVAAQVSGIAGSEDLAGAMGTLNAIVGAGNMRMEDLVGALSTGILPAAKSFGLGLKDVGAALDVMTAAGVPAQDAATRLRMTFSLLGAPTTAATTQLQKLGLSSIELADTMRNKGIVPALDLLKQKLDDSGMTASQQAEVIARAFGGGRTSSAILTLLQNTDKLHKDFDSIGTSAGKFGEQVASTAQTAQAKMATFHAQMQTLSITVGNTLIPIMTMLAQKLEGVLTWFEHLSPATQKVILVIVGLVAILGPLLVLLGSVITAAGVVAVAIGAITLPIILIVAGIAALIAIGILLVTHWHQVAAVAHQVWADIVGVWQGSLKAVEQATAGAVLAVASFFASLPGRLLGAIGSIPGIFGGIISRAVATVASFGGAFFSAGANLIHTFANGVSSAIGHAISAVAGVLSRVRNLLPFSDAKEGPLSDLTKSGMRFSETFAAGISASADHLKSAVSNSLGQSLQPAQAQRMMPSSSQTTNNSTAQITIQHLVLNTPAAVSQFFTQLDRDNLLALKGLTPTRGLT